MADDALTKNLQLANLGTNLFGSLFGKTTQTGGSTTETTTKNISQEGIDALLKSLLEGTTGRPGLARISSGQKAPGLYNSTSQTLLVNDLLSRAAAEVETARTPTVRTTTTPTLKTPGSISASTGLLAGAGLLAASPSARKGLSDLTASIFGVAELSGTGAGAGAISVANPDYLAGIPSYIQNAGDFSSPLTSMGSAVDTATSMGGGLDWATLDIGGASVPWVGSAMNLMQGDVGGAVGSALGGWAGSSLGASLGTVGGPIGMVLGSVLGDALFGDDGGCFITTAACCVMGLEDDCHELTVLRNYRDTWLTENYPEAIKEYYTHAPYIVELIKTKRGASTVFKHLFSEYILKAVDAIQDGKNQEAYEIYKSMVSFADELAHTQEVA